ncbi:MAG: class II fructose-bisphosphate aldolase [Candidatus Shapirobacteria bacterium]|jgi:ketose-bisphosphate aldolase
MTSLLQLLASLRSQKLAVPAFNIDSWEIFQSIVRSLRAHPLPCIVQLSAGEDKFVEAENLFLLARRARIDGLPIYLNMDHGQDPTRLLSLVKLGFDMVHLDLSGKDYVTAVAQARDFVKSAKSINPQVIVETEFNHINLVGTDVDPSSWTDPAQASEFALTTKTDLLAVSIGNLHGVNTLAPEKLDLTLLSAIRAAVPESLNFTLHGGSGLSREDITAAIAQGVVKININTDLRLQCKQSLLREINSTKSDKIYDYLSPVIDDLTTIINQKLLQFSPQNLQ